MESLLNIPHLNTSLDWDETKFSVFYYIYDIESCPGNSSSSVRIDTLRSGSESHSDLNAQFRLYLEGFGGILITILGIFGNSLSAWILSRPKMKSPINSLLLGLAMADTGFIFSNLTIIALPTIVTHWNIDASFFVLLTPFVFPIACTAHSASVYLTLAVTIERYIAVYHPFKARSCFTWRQATYIALTIFGISFLYNLPKFWEFEIIGIVNETNTVVRYVPVSTELRRNPFYEKYYCYISYFVLGYSVPLVILIVFNTLIYQAIKRANLHRRIMSSQEHNENELAKMLVAVVLVFILCNAMTLVNIAAKVISGSPSIPGVDSCRNFTIILNSCINFIIYCAYGEKFRDIFIQMLPEWARRLCCKHYIVDRGRSYSQSSRSNSSDKSRPLSIITSSHRSTSFRV